MQGIRRRRCKRLRPLGVNHDSNMLGVLSHAILARYYHLRPWSLLHLPVVEPRLDEAIV